MKHTDIINSLDLEQKCALLSGGTVFTTRALPGKGIPAITLSDGPNGVRKQGAFLFQAQCLNDVCVFHSLAPDDEQRKGAGGYPPPPCVLEFIR